MTEPVVTPRADASDPLVGQLLDGRYRVEVAVGEGGQGVVYRGVQVNVDRAVAIKVLRPGASSDAEVVRRFEAEARIISALRHPNTLRLIDFGRLPDGRLFLVTEFLHGRSLADVLRDGPLTPQRALDLIAQICGALDEAHREGVVHRDLKPANIFVEQVGSEELAKVLDFGVAKLSTQTVETAQGMIIGTPMYMSPEQARGERVDARTDLYSLGVVLFHCLGGVPPFSGENPYSVLNKHVSEPPPRLIDVNPTLAAPPELEVLVKRLLAKSRDDRPSTAAAARTLMLGVRRQITPGRDHSIETARTLAPGDSDLSGLSPVAPRSSVGKVAALAGGLIFVGSVAAWIATRPAPGPAVSDAGAVLAVTVADAAVGTAPGRLDAAPPPRDAAPRAPDAATELDAAAPDAGVAQRVETLAGEDRWADAVVELSAHPAAAIPAATRARVEQGYADAELAAGLAVLDEDRAEAEATLDRLQGLPYAAAQAAALKKALADASKPARPVPHKRAVVNRAQRDQLFKDALAKGLDLMGKDNAGSIQAFRQAAHLKPGNFKPHQRLCTMYKALGDRANALQQCKLWLATEPRKNYAPMIQRQIDELQK